MKTKKLRSAYSAIVACFIVTLIVFSFPTYGISDETADDSFDIGTTDENVDMEAADDNVDGEANDELVNEYLGNTGLKNENGILLNQLGEEIPPESSGGEEAIESTCNSDSKEQLLKDKTSVDPSDDRLLIEESLGANNCTTRWVHGSHKWKYKYYLLYTYAKFQAATWTTWGTPRRSCGTPLRANRLFFNARVGDDQWTNFSWKKTGYPSLC